MSGFEAAWEFYRERTERALVLRLSGLADVPDRSTLADSSERSGLTDAPERLREAIEYACLNGGKRFRAMLVYACGEMAGASLEQLDVPAVAVEMVHAYSLVHDDLPAMDDDDLRRGRASCHVAYDEATAILVGDALQTLAFEILANDSALALSSERRLQMIETLAHATGARGMAGGQMLDMEATGGTLDVEQLSRVHRLKTGALIRAAARLGGLAGEHADEAWLGHLDRYAASIGLAFQIVDDILDEGGLDENGSGEDGMNKNSTDKNNMNESGINKNNINKNSTNKTTATGKRNGADRRMHKATYVSVCGMQQAKAEARKLSENALESAALLGDNSEFLVQLAHFVVNRRF